MNHYLKIFNTHYLRLCSKQKLAEVRINDRDYQCFDTISYRLPEREIQLDISYEITHVHAGLGLLPGYVMLSLRKLPKKGSK